MDPWIAIVVVWVLALASPIAINYFNQRVRVRERAEDLARQDIVARKADETARLLQDAQKLTVEKADEVAAVAASVAKSVAAVTKSDTAETHAQLRQIHTLVNSEMTAARQGELDQARRTLIVLRRVVVLTETAGHQASPEERAEIELTEKRITELEAIIADRMTQFRIAEAEAKKP